MPTNPQIIEIFQQCCHEILLWVGFGTLVGLAGKGIMPGKDPGGAVGTMMLGIMGSVIGCGTMIFFMPDMRISPVSIPGFCLGTAGSFFVLLMYRLLSGSMFAEAEDSDHWFHRYRRNRRRRNMIHES
jgi:uncharacterized membrane protein YeaQ/YmgE (transglycosylase-associated protein family)